MIAEISGFAIALAIGLLIGIERERNKGSGPGRAAAGIRTFAVVAMAGAAAMRLQGSAMVGLVMALVAALIGLAYWRRPSADPGLTTEVTLVLTPLLGAMAMVDQLAASMIGVVVVILLAAKPPMHRFVRTTLTAAEINDGLVLAIVAVVIWPLLPDKGFGPGGVINPHMLGLVAILVLGIGLAGHVAMRLFGPRFGLPVSGLASGFVSSVATIGAMGGRARAEPTAIMAAVTGATLSSLATFVEMALVLAAVSVPALRALTPALITGGAVIVVYASLIGWRAVNAGRVAIVSGTTFSIKSAVVMVGGLVGILLITATLQPLFGGAGLIFGAAFGGIVDTHAAAMSIAAIVAAGQLAPADAVIPVLTAMTANALMKIIMAFGTGGRSFGLYIAAGVGISILAAWSTLLFFPR